MVEIYNLTILLYAYIQCIYYWFCNYVYILLYAQFTIINYLLTYSLTYTEGLANGNNFNFVPHDD